MIATTAVTIASGALVGFSLGLVGGGGSILATPLLLYVVGVAQPHVAIGTSALAVAVNALVNFAAHARAGNVRWLCAGVFAVIGTVGAVLGSSVGKSFDGDRLLLLFALLMVVVGALMLRPRREVADDGRPVGLATCAFTGVLALLAGMTSGFFGVGGGFLIVPALLLATRMPMIQAIGSSLLAVAAFGAATASNYALSGLIDWRIAGEFIAGGIAGGVLGMMAATRLARRKSLLNRIFAIMIFVVAGYVGYRSLAALTG